MQNRQSGRRRRGGGGGGNNPRPMGMAGGQNANRLEVRVRGNAHQLLEKYKQLARDAHQAGDRVASEYYLQHADHYFRVLNDSRIRQEEMRARRGVFDPFEDEGAGSEADEAAEAGSADGQGGDGEDGGDAPARDRNGDRPRGSQGDRQRWQERRPDRRDERPRDERSRDERPRDDRPRDERSSDGPRPDRERGERQPRLQPAAAEAPLSDGEAALVAFGGVPARDAADGGEAGGDAPKPRRRGRPRKVEAEPVEG